MCARSAVGPSSCSDFGSRLPYSLLLSPSHAHPPPNTQAAGETASTFYNLSDNVFVPATVAPRGVVSVWLGANVMLEYSYDEARALFTEQLAAATTKVATNSSDLAFLRDQVITTEVNLARVYNYSVKETRRQKLAAEQLLAAAAAPAAAPAATPTALQQA